MALIESARDHRDSPLDVVEHMAAGNNWPFERAGEDEIGLGESWQSDRWGHCAHQNGPFWSVLVRFGHCTIFNRRLSTV